MRRRRATILAAVLVVTALAAMIVVGLMFRVRAEAAAGAAGYRGNQAMAAVFSGVNHAMAILAESADDPSVWTDAPELFEHQLALVDGEEAWYFTIHAPRDGDDRQVRMGLIDESGKINVNLAGPDLLLRIPGMTPALVDCLADYRDPDDEARVEGAEQAWYDQLPWPYLIKNRPLIGTLEELLLVRGYTGQVVYGEDHNLNGLLDASEDDGDETFPPDDGDGILDRGLRGVLTSFAYDPDRAADGSRRIEINGDAAELRKLDEVPLPRETIEFIRTYRAEGNTFEHPVDLLNMRYRTTGEQAGADRRDSDDRRDDRRNRRNRRDRRNRDRREQEDRPRWIESGVGAEELPIVLDRLTTRSRGGKVVPRLGEVTVNVNTASMTVLSLLDGLDATRAATIVDARAGLDAQTRDTCAWLYAQDVLDEETFRRVAPRLVTRGWQFRMLIVAYGQTSGRFRSAEVVVDLAGERPRIVYLRETTRLGLPFPMLDTQETAR